jgi:hypothetical protein
VFDSSIHLAPNAPWLILVLATVGVGALGLWAYRFSIPPLPMLARRALTALRVVALAALLWLLAQPVLERTVSGGARLAVLIDRSRSMDLPSSPGGPTRARAADRVLSDLERAWQGRASIDVLPFATRLASDSSRTIERGSTAIGDALNELATSPEGQRASGVVVVSDGAVNAGDDPVTAARTLGIPVHTVVVGSSRIPDRAIIGIDASSEAQVGHATPVRVHVASTEERGTRIAVRVLEDGRELARATVLAPGPGQEAVAEMRVTPLRPGLALWNASADSLPGEITAANNTRGVAIEVAPGRIGIAFLSSGLNWDATFVHRALAGDSSLEVGSWVRERGTWTGLDRGKRGEIPGPATLRGRAVVILDAIAPAEISPGFDQAMVEFVHAGGAVMAIGGPAPGLMRLRAGRFGHELALATSSASSSSGSPVPAPEAREALAWDDDPARGEQAWRAAAPLAELAPVRVGAGDRVLVQSSGNGPPLLFTRRMGRGQVLLVNGTGLWRWSLSGHDDLTTERGRRLWRNLTHWLAEPVQGEPLRIRPERWLASSGEPVRLFATLQDDQFRPVSGASVEGEVTDAKGRARRVEFTPRAAGSYVTEVAGLAPGRYRVSARASRGGSGLGRASSEFGVDAWSLEEARTLPDSVTLAAMSLASGGRVSGAEDVRSWARSLTTRALTRGRTESARLWESPWAFGAIVGALSVEWIWRRRRGLP